MWQCSQKGWLMSRWAVLNTQCFLLGSVCFLRAQTKHYPANKQSVLVFSVGQQVWITSSAHKSPRLLQHELSFFLSVPGMCSRASRVRVGESKLISFLKANVFKEVESNLQSISLLSFCQCLYYYWAFNPLGKKMTRINDVTEGGNMEILWNLTSQKHIFVHE